MNTGTTIYEVDNLLTSTGFLSVNDLTKRALLNLDSLTPSSVRTISVPDADFVMVGTSLTQILTNKYIDALENTIVNIGNTNIINNASINVTKLASGNISNADFECLNKIRSNIQQQFDDHAGSSTTHNVTGSIVGTSDSQILTNKLLTDSNNLYQNASDNSKKVRFSLNPITTNTTRVVEFPDDDCRLVGLETPQVFKNKTYDCRVNTLINVPDSAIAQGINVTKLGDGSISNSELYCLKGATSPLQSQFNAHTHSSSAHGVSSNIVGESDSQTLTNKSIDGKHNTITNIDNDAVAENAKINVNKLCDGTVSNEDFLCLQNVKSNIQEQIDDHAKLTIAHGTTSAIVGINDSQVLQNKTIDAEKNRLSNVGDTSLKAGINANKIADGTVSNTEFKYISGVSSNIQTQINTHLNSTSCHGVSGNIVGTSDSQILSNKSFGTTIDMINNKIINLLSPTAPFDAANKSYVDSVASGLEIKESVTACSVDDLGNEKSVKSFKYTEGDNKSVTEQITIVLSSSILVIDEIEIVNGSRILLKNQKDSRQNGIWIASYPTKDCVLQRPQDFSNGNVTTGNFMFVENGSQNKNTGWVLITQNPITIGTQEASQLSFSQFSGVGSMDAGPGLTRDGNVFSAVGSSSIISSINGLSVNSSNTANQILLSSGNAGTPSTFGALPLNNSSAVTGVLPITNGGTGVSSFANGDKIVSSSADSKSLVTTSISPSSLALLTTSQTFSNKSFVDSSTWFVDNVDSTKKFQFDASPGSPNGTSTFTVPPSSTTLVGTNSTQSLSNKTLLNPVLNDSILDVNNKTLLKVIPTTNAVNYFTFTNSIAGSSPTFSPAGLSTNININLLPKGNGNVIMSGLKFPNTDGLPGSVLKTDGSGNLTFTTVTTDVTATTTTNSKTVTATIPTIAGHTYMIKATIIAKRTDLQIESCGYIIYALFRNSTSLNRVGKQKLDFEENFRWNADIDASDSNIVINVTGENGKTISWSVSYTVEEI